MDWRWSWNLEVVWLGYLGRGPQLSCAAASTSTYLEAGTRYCGSTREWLGLGYHGNEEYLFNFINFYNVA